MTGIELDKLIRQISVLIPSYDPAKHHIVRTVAFIARSDAVTPEAAYSRIERALTLGISWEHLERNG